MKKIIIAIFLLYLYSCSKITSESYPDEPEYAIAVNEASQVLIKTLEELHYQTKSVEIKISSVDIVSSNDLKSRRTKESSTNIDNLLYLFNFADSSGYAIVAADTRILDPIIMIADIGNIGKEIFHADREDSFIYNLIGDYAVLSTDAPIAPGDREDGGDGGTIGGNIGVNNVLPMLQTTWHQGYPYNYFCPVMINDTLAPAGCIPIAMAQIFNYYQYPHINDNLNIPFASNYNIDYSLSGIPRLIENIGLRTDIDYDIDGSGTTMAKAKTAMEEYYAYEDVTKYNLYREDIILDMISEHKPVLIGASNQWIGGSGHAWVIDGYMYSSTAGHLLHCNMGWGGPGNGYYASGVFDVTSGTAPYYPDNTTNINPDGENLDFAYHYRIIDYTRPR